MKEKIVVLSLVLLVWMITLSLHLYFFIRNGLKFAGDGYDTEWQFQLLAFAYTRLPFYIIGLGFFLILTISLSTYFFEKNH